MSSIAVSSVPYQPKTVFRPTITERRCRTCTHPDREAIEADLIEEKISYKELGKKWEISINSLFNHKVRHISRRAQELATDYSTIDAKVLLSHAYERAHILHGQFHDDTGRTNASRAALEHEAMLLKATGNWRESRDITLGGSIQLTAADKADADYLVFMRERHPEMLAEYEQWAERRLLAEVQPALTADSVQPAGSTSIPSYVHDSHDMAHAEKLLEDACTDGET